jgi:hypothetical protein
VKSKSSNTNPVKLKRSFNFLGHFYNPLKQFFLANTPEKVISKSVPYFGKHQNILVVGGGADNTVQELIKNACCSEITHLDISSVLSEKAKLRIPSAQNRKNVNVNFVVCAFLEYEPEIKYDAMVFPFYLDLFFTQEVIENINKAKGLLSSNSSIYVIDFAASKDLNWFNDGVVKLLYLLFYPLTNVFRKSTPDYNTLFLNNGFVKKRELAFYNGLYSFKEFEWLK